VAKFKLTYFDFDGGRGEPIRIALHAANIAFEDVRLTFPQFGEIRSKLRFNSLPVAEIDGVTVTQSNALLRYVGKQANLYPSDAKQALYCDEVMDALEDITHYIVPTFSMQGDELKAARQKLVDGWITTYVRGLGELLKRGGGKYFAGDRLTIADLKAFLITRWLTAGSLDHVPTDLVQRLAPELVEHEKRVAADPVVTAYYASRK